MLVSGWWVGGHVEYNITYTRKMNMEPEHGPLEDYSPLQLSGFQVPCQIFIV